MSDSSTRATQIGDLKRLQTHFRYLAARSRQYLGTIPSWLQDEAVVDLEVLALLRSSIESLVGPDQLEAQRACGEAHGHPDRRICDRCGFSINLYLGAFEKILRRKDQATRVGKRRKKRRGVSIRSSQP
jgi:hypothetical protein